MTNMIRPALGLLQGCIIYWLLFHTQLSHAALISAAIVLTFPLFAMQVKLPNKNSLVLGLSILVVMALIYGYIAYYLVTELANPASSSYVLAFILAIQCAISSFIFFIFYCVAVEEGRFVFPYASLFSEAWQVILKLFLGKILVSLTWGLFLLASWLFELLDIMFIHTFVVSNEFLCIMVPCFFGISMTILHQYEDVLTKLRNILLAFCQFLYPIFVVISISFLLIVPFASKNFADFWQITILLSALNIILFNGIFQAGFDRPPYSTWFCGLIYASMILTLIYSFYVLKFPLVGLQGSGIEPEIFLLAVVSMVLLALYNLCYSLAIFFSKKPWLSMVKVSNTILALVVAFLYLGMALPWFHIATRFAVSQ